MGIKKEKFIIGLGNPGDKYKDTYHNAGLIMLDYIKQLLDKKYKVKKTWKHPHSKHFRYIKYKNIKLIKSDAFMNESGMSVKEAIKYFSTKPSQIIILHDDSDIKIGEFKISFGRGSAGHKGVESTIRTLRTKNFSRVRIGIRSDEDNQAKIRLKAESIVLEKIPAGKQKLLKSVFDSILKTSLFKDAISL